MRSTVAVEFIGFFFTFASFNTLANFSSHAMAEDNFQDLGFISNGIVYFVFAIVSLFSSVIVNHRLMGLKRAHVLGSFCYLVYALAFLAPAFNHLASKENTIPKIAIRVIVCTGAAICGFGAGVIWPAQGALLTECANGDETKKI